MKTNIYPSILILLFIILFGMVSVSIAQGDTKKKQKSYITFEYYKNSDGSKLLNAILKTKVDKKFQPINSATLSFWMESDSGSIALNTISTDHEGIARCEIPENIDLPLNEEGYTSFIVNYKGDDIYKPKKKSLDIMDVNFDMELDMIDSIKTVKISAFIYIDDEGLGVDRKKVGVFVQRMFSQLKVAEGSLKNGKCKIKFPDDIPGDTLGNITVFAKIEEDDDFGTVEKMQVIGWGIPVTEKESFKKKFSGNSYLIFWAISLLVVVVIVFVAKKIKIPED